MLTERNRRPLMLAALALIGLLAAAVLARPGPTTAVIGNVTGWAITHGGNAFLWFSSALLLLAAAVALSPLGRLRLGRADERPEFGTLSWLAMLFAAGMGSGLVFWGVAEPLTHVVGVAEDASNPAAEAMAITWFHWGLHAWGIYAIAALAIAWFHTRLGSHEMPSAGIELGWQGWLPDAVLGPLGRLADAFAIVAVVFGVAGALANSLILLRVGLASLLGHAVPEIGTPLVLLGLLSIAFLVSASTGIRQGIRWLSNLNIVLALVILAALFVLGMPGAVIALTVDSAATWLSQLPRWSVDRIAVDGGFDWAAGWTVTYLVWWIAWTPFVGLFIARISRGRSLRTFIAGVVLVPTIFSLAWFAVLGGGALAFDAGHGGALQSALATHYTQPLFTWLDALPLGGLLGWLTCALLFVFMITSADSASYVLGMLSGATTRPRLRARLGWGILVALLTAGLLLRNDVDVNKAVAIIGAIPFTIFLALQVVGLARSLWAARPGS